MKHLTSNITSAYIEAANRLRPKTKKRKIVAYVESYDDIFFWRSVLSEFEDEQTAFEVMLPSRKNLNRGKKTVLMNKLGESLGQCMIACVDADLDYLLQRQTPSSEKMLSSPYIIHTYAYDSTLKSSTNSSCGSSGFIGWDVSTTSRSTTSTTSSLLSN